MSFLDGLSDFLSDFAITLHNNNGETDTDHPTCPQCGSTMNFHGVNLPIGDAYWDCPNCPFSFTEEDIEELWEG